MEVRVIDLTKTRKFYVYMFFNKDWGLPFYIGKGTNNRVNQTDDRNFQIKAILERYDCERKILCDNLTEEDALIYEDKLKITLKGMGYPIIDYENSNCSTNQRAGIERAKREGKYTGRKQVIPQQFEALYKKYLNKEINKTKMAKELNISRPTLDKLIKNII